MVALLCSVIALAGQFDSTYNAYARSDSGSAIDKRIQLDDSVQQNVSKDNAIEHSPTLGVVLSFPLNGSVGTQTSSLPGLPAGVGALGGTTIGCVLGIATESIVQGLEVLKYIGIQSEKRFRVGMNIDVQLFDGLFAASTGASGLGYEGRLSLASVGIASLLRYSTAWGVDVQGGVRLGFNLRGGYEWTVRDNGMLVSAQSIGLNDIGASALQGSLLLAVSYPVELGGLFIRPELVLQQPLSSSAVEFSSWGQPIGRLRLGGSVHLPTERIWRMTTPLDTIYYRDTSIVMIASGQAERVQRVERSVSMPTAYKKASILVDVVGQLLLGRLGDSLSFSSNRELSSASEQHIVVRESYIREVPKPMPILTASVDAEFLMPDGRKEKTTRVKAMKTSVQVFAHSPVLPSVTSSLALSSERAWNKHTIQPALNTDKRSIHGANSTALEETTLYVLTDTLFTSRLPPMRFYPHIISEVDVQSWRLSILQRSAMLAEFGGGSVDKGGAKSGERNRYGGGEHQDVIALEWLSEAAVIHSNEALRYQLSVVDADGQHSIADSGVIKVELDFPPATASVERCIDVAVLDSIQIINNACSISAKDIMLLKAVRSKLQKLYTLSMQHSLQVRLVLNYAAATSVHINSTSLAQTLSQVLSVPPEQIVIVCRHRSCNETDFLVEQTVVQRSPQPEHQKEHQRHMQGVLILEYVEKKK
jgi:hypothetical protein